MGVDGLSRYLTAGGARIPGILAFRLLPFVAFAAVTRAYSWPARLLVLGAYASVANLAAQEGATPFYWLVFAYLYFGVAVWVAYELLPYARSNALWFASVAILFWVLPSAVLHPQPKTSLVLGWDFTLAAYSYGVDTRKGTAPPLRDFLFFVLVNPALVYHNRGTQLGAPRADAAGLARAALGIFALLLCVGPIEIARAYAVARSHASASAGGMAAAGWLAMGVLGFCHEYALQSGVASLQIGCMKQLGWRLPERYRYPWLARSPADFWRRWNTYVGGWAQTYVFVPLALALPRRSRRGRDRTLLVYGAAAVLTFAVVGALHDVFVISSEWRWSAFKTAWFAAMGCLVVVWEALVRRKGGGKARAGSIGAAQRALFLLAGICAAAGFR